jgi:hypothetical protein
MYHQAPSKPDDPSLDKYFYICQTPGCGAVINPLFPVGLKNPAPVHCKDCQNAETRKAIEADYKAHFAPQA